MNSSIQIAKHLREVYFGGNWTASDLKGQLANVTWQQAIAQVHSLNSIATLVYHINYYVGVVSNVLQGGPLDGKDNLSFEHPNISSQQDWEDLLEKTWMEAENFATLVEHLPENKLWEDFWDGKYGNYYRNIYGIIEHVHYHLGQIVLIKKILARQNEV